ncbi:MAG: preprotein translocase subunit YajC [Phycisphaerales bacterium]|nr:preprotein translocase subunit YajC [Phycisphaerales bacterium]
MLTSAGIWCVTAVGQAGTTDASAPPPPMSSGPGQPVATATTSADGTTTTGAPPQASPFGGDFFLILILVMVVVVGFSMLSQRKEKKRRASMLASVGRQDTVQTIGGLIGRVIELKPDRVVIETDKGSGTRITVSRQALQQVLESSEASGGTEDSAA